MPAETEPLQCTTTQQQEEKKHQNHEDDRTRNPAKKRRLKSADTSSMAPASTLCSPAVKFFSKSNNLFFGHFDPVDSFFDNKNK